MRENLVQRQFNPDSLNAVWAGDITYVKTALGWVSKIRDRARK